MILAMYDVSGIQQYIFQSSRMKENVGASRIVGDILKVHLPNVLEQRYASGTGQQVISEWCEEQSFSFLMNQDVMIEVIYIGGGNALIAYRHVEDYHAVNEQLAKRLLIVSHTLYLAVAAIESTGNFIKDKGMLENRMSTVKAQMQRPQPPGAFPISEQETQSGLPITAISLHRNVSRLQWLKLEAIPQENKQEPVPFPSNEFGYKRWAFEMNELIEEREIDSLVAIVHIDGNGMGKQLREKQRELYEHAYSEAVHEMRQLSKYISSGYSEVFNKTIVDLMEIQPTDRWKKVTTHLPIRPLIMDGDDLTIVCLGAWGVPFAARLLKQLEKTSRTASQDFISLSACAGVALVHSHFPFNLGYEVAEACCKRAKKKRADEGGSFAYLDFEIVRDSNPQLSNRQSSLRARPYQITAYDHSLPDKSVLDSKQRPDNFNMLAACIAKITDSGWPNWRLERLYSALVGDLKQLEFYLQECKSRGYRLDQLLPEDVFYRLGAKQCNVSIDAHRLLLDALDLYQMFDQKVWFCDKGGTE
ncbi:hypothetical protein ACFQZE_00485 [Paenibacillus sp. GCM10027627]|uniref:Cas10/Cmr2 second palm domain-containing protein n=1 Tax=unclassified Paenibacillus TaxID=185978 RepID=UPI00364220EE